MYSYISRMHKFAKLIPRIWSLSLTLLQLHFNGFFFSVCIEGLTRLMDVLIFHSKKKKPSKKQTLTELNCSASMSTP